MALLRPQIALGLQLAALVLTASRLFALAPASPPSIAETLQPFVDRQALAGAVALVADKDKVLGITTVGYADVTAKAPMPPNALFWIASMSKPVTAAAVMMLVDEGKIHLDDPVETYLPEFKGQMVVSEKDDAHVLLKKPAHPITVRNVLSHTSGLPFKSALEEPISAPPTSPLSASHNRDCRNRCQPRRISWRLGFPSGFSVRFSTTEGTEAAEGRIEPIGFADGPPFPAKSPRAECWRRKQ